MPEDKKSSLTIESLVEAILNYGTEASVKQLFDICGIELVAQIFYRQISQPRSNYFPITKHYFNLYFRKHAHRNPEAEAD